MSHPIKNIEHSTVLPLAEQVTYQPGQIVSKTLAQNKHHNVTLFAFDKNEEIQLRQETLRFIHILHAGDCIVMPAKIPHAVYALERFKMLLIVLFTDAQE